MKVVATSTPGTGHLHALFPLLVALQQAGHDITVVTAPQAGDAVERAGFAARVGGMDVQERMQHFGPRMAEALALPPRRRRGVLFSGIFADAAAPAMRPQLAAVLDEVRPDVVIHEMAELAAAPLATSRGIPHVTVAFSGALPSWAEELLIERITPLWAEEGLAAPSMADINGACYLHPFPPSFGQLPEGEAVQTDARRAVRSRRRRSAGVARAPRSRSTARLPHGRHRSDGGDGAMGRDDRRVGRRRRRRHRHDRPEPRSGGPRDGADERSSRAVRAAVVHPRSRHRRDVPCGRRLVARCGARRAAAAVEPACC